MCTRCTLPHVPVLFTTMFYTSERLKEYAQECIFESPVGSCVFFFSGFRSCAWTNGVTLENDI